jgi:hypothetical protein
MFDNEDRSTVISICPFPVTKTIPHTNPGNFYIDPCGDNEEFKFLVVKQATTLVYMDIERGYQPRDILSAELARAIVEDHINSSLKATRGHAEPGLFWARGEFDAVSIKKSLTKELEISKERQKRWFIALVDQADIDWAKTHSPRSISDLQRTAAKKLQLRKEWDTARIVSEIANCPACQAIVHPQAFLCNCGYILDIVKYEKNSAMFVKR